MIHDALLYPGVSDSHTHVGFYPSSASVEYQAGDGTNLVLGKCLRSQYYSHCGVPRLPLEPDVAVKLEMGNWTHEMIVELVKRSGFWMGDERRIFISGPPPVSGRADLFVKDPRDGSPVGCEIKSVGGYYGVKTTITGADARPKDDHILQCMPYLEFYGQWGLNRWILLYIDRDSGAMAEYVIMLEDDGSANVQGENFADIYRHINLKAIKHRWNKLLNCIAEGRLPEQDYALQWSNKEILRRLKAGDLNKTDTASVEKKLKAGKTDGLLLKKGDWQCAYCDFKDKCYGTSPDVSSDEVNPMTKPVNMSPEQLANIKGKGKKTVTDKVDGGEVF